jgi:hypothetical protein
MISVNKDAIKFSSPIISVQFTSVSGDRFTATSFEFGGIILSLQTRKTINTLPGTFNITMVGKNNFNDFFQIPNTEVSPYELFRPSGLVEISINNKQIMIGLIDTITKNLTIDQKGKPVKNYVIAGRDLGAFLINHKIWYDDVVYKQREKQNTMMGALSSFGMVGNEKSGEIIEKVINNWMIDVVNKDIQINDQTISSFQFSDGTKIQNRFIAMLNNKQTYSTLETGVVIKGPGAISNNTYADEYPINFAMSFVQGSLASFLQNIVSSPFNEMFVDTGDAEVVINSDVPTFSLKKGQSFVVFRPTPFDDPNFDIEGPASKLTMSNLINFEIDDTVIKQKQLNMNKNKKTGVYFVSPANETLGFVQGKFYTSGEYDETAIRRYGYDTMNVRLGGYEAGAESSSGNIESLVSDFQKKLKSWFERSDEYLNGAFIIKGDERVRIGNKLNYVRDECGKIEDSYEEGYYYIVGVTQDWAYGRDYKTIVNVERGISKKIFKKENASAPVPGSNLGLLTLRLG